MNGLQIDVELIIVVVAAIVWMIRLEGRVTRNADRVLDLENRVGKTDGLVTALNSNITSSLHELALAVARIETKMGIDPMKER